MYLLFNQYRAKPVAMSVFDPADSDADSGVGLRALAAGGGPDGCIESAEGGIGEGGAGDADGEGGDGDAGSDGRDDGGPIYVDSLLLRFMHV